MTSRWSDIDWNAVIAGERTADRYYARTGLIAKERLALFAPSANHPKTSVAFESFGGLAEALKTLGNDSSPSPLPPVDLQHDAQKGSKEALRIRFVLKQAHSSNASAIRFLSVDEARTVCHLAAGTLRQKNSLLHAGWPTVVTCTSALAIFTMWLRSHQRRSSAIGIGGAIFIAFAISPWIVMSQKAKKTNGSAPRCPHAFAMQLQDLLTTSTTDGNAKPRVWILQRHIESALIRERKFHLRVLLLCVGDLDAYVHTNVRVLLATVPFEVARQDGSNLRAHVTNMGVQLLLDKPGVYDNQAQNMSLEEAVEFLDPSAGAMKFEDVFNEICRIFRETLTRLRTEQRRQFFTLPNCWELFGADFLIEAGTHRVVLLEVNPSPSLAMYGKDSAEVRKQFLGSNPLKGEIAPEWKPCFSSAHAVQP